MKKFSALMAATGAVLVLAGGITFAQDQLQSLRGASVDESRPLDATAPQQKQRFVRAYRQQPPLIPHAIDQYQIDKDVNQCLGCHDWSNAGEKNAPTLSMTHYLDRDGHQGDTVAGTRWFCNQCHVVQEAVDPVVENTFVPSASR